MLNRFKVCSLLLVSLAGPAFGQAPTSSLSANVAEPEPAVKRTNLSVSAGIMGNSLEDKYVNSKYSGGIVTVEGQHRFNSMLSGRLSLSTQLTSGSFTNQYSDEGAAPNGMGLNEIVVAFEPNKMFSIEAGVIPMEFSSMPSTWEAVGFPSLREKFKFEGDLVGLSVFAMQSIAASGTKTVQPTESGLTTTVNTFGASLTSNPKDERFLTVEAGATRFEFKNLNSSAAVESQYLGNTVVSPGSQARFAYQFAGYEYGSAVAYKFASGVKARLSGALLRNEEAPTDSNRGYVYSASLMVPVGTTEVTASGGYFYNESDTLPGSYTSGAKGSNNRFGQNARLTIKQPKDGMAGYVQYTKANEIEDKPYTADREIINFGLEVKYEIL